MDGEESQRGRGIGRGTGGGGSEGEHCSERIRGGRGGRDTDRGERYGSRHRKRVPRDIE